MHGHIPPSWRVHSSDQDHAPDRAKRERADGGGSGREARSWGREGERAGLADFDSRPRGIREKEGH